MKPMKPRSCMRIEGLTIRDYNIHDAERILRDNGIEKDEADTVLQAIGYALLGNELYLECDPVKSEISQSRKCR